MIARLKALLEKEILQHLLAGIVLVLLLGLGLLVVILFSAVQQSTVSMLQGHLFFLWVFLPLGAAILGNRLVVAEWYGKTQLFVEALPLHRGELVLVKYVLGLLLVFFLADGSLAISCLIAMRKEPIDGRFFEILSARTLVYSWTIWSFFFTMGFLGRFRIPIYIGIGLALVAIGTLTEVNVWHFGPFELVSGAKLAFERTDFPTEALAVSAGMAAAWTALAFVLATINEGSVAENLSRRMSQKEKVAIGVIFVAALSAMSGFEKRREKKPYEFTNPEVLNEKGIAINYATDDAKERASEILGKVARDLTELREAMGWDELGAIRVAHNSRLDKRTFECARLEKNDGVLVRANLKHCDIRALEALLVHNAIGARTRWRATFEPRHWVLDGFSRWWVERGSPKSEPWSRALWVTRARPVDQAWLDSWQKTEEALGDPIAEGLAYSGIVVLEEERGRGAVLALARALFERRASEDFREVLRERAHPLSRVFRETTGIELEDFYPLWNRALERGRKDESALLEKVPEGRGRLEIKAVEEDIRSVVYGFDFTRPPSKGTPVALLHKKIFPFDTYVDPVELERSEHVWREGQTSTAVLGPPGKYGRGTRALLALEVEADALNAPIRLASERSEIP